MNNNVEYFPPKICTHMNKLLKKNIQTLLKEHDYADEPICKQCRTILKSSKTQIQIKQITINICLHCGALFCNNEKCVYKHEKDTHLFWATLLLHDNSPSLLQQQYQNSQKNVVLYCKICGNIDNQLANTYSSEIMIKQEEKLNKLNRFKKFLHQNLDQQLPQLIISKFKEYFNKKLCVFGLRNMGNTCFLNTVLQILYYSQPFHQISLNFQNRNNESPYKMISKQKKKKKQIEYYYDCFIDKYQSECWHVVTDKKTKSKQKIERKQMEKFVPLGFVKDYKFNKIFNNFILNITNSFQATTQSQTNQFVIFQPIQILSSLKQLDNRYSSNKEQDAQQLLILIIDTLSQGQMLAMMVNSADKKQKYNKVEKLLGRQKLSPIQQIFGSYLASYVVCLGCGKGNWTTDFTYHFPISLKVHIKQEKSVEEPTSAPIQGINYYQQLWYPGLAKQNCKLLEPLFQAEKLTSKQNFYTCQQCSSPSAIKKFYIVDPPQILIISFKRFQHQTKSKISRHVPFEQFIDISQFVLREREQNEQKQQERLGLYQLYGIIVHKGQTMSSGHYTCFIKVAKNEKQKGMSIWYEFSDEKSRRVSWKEISNQQAYIIFYNKLGNK